MQPYLEAFPKDSADGRKSGADATRSSDSKQGSGEKKSNTKTGGKKSGGKSGGKKK